MDGVVLVLCPFFYGTPLPNTFLLFMTQCFFSQIIRLSLRYYYASAFDDDP